MPLVSLGVIRLVQLPNMRPLDVCTCVQKFVWSLISTGVIKLVELSNMSMKLSCLESNLNSYLLAANIFEASSP